MLVVSIRCLRVRLLGSSTRPARTSRAGISSGLRGPDAALVARPAGRCPAASSARSGSHNDRSSPRAAGEVRAKRGTSRAALRLPSKATVTGGYGRDGVPRAGCSSNPVGCAEDDVARQIGGDPKDVTFTEAIRPRTGDQVPICPRCQGVYDQSQFPPGTLFDPAGPWGSR